MIRHFDPNQAESERPSAINPHEIQYEFLLSSAFVVLCVRLSFGTTSPAKRGIAFLGAMFSEPKDQPLSELAAILAAGLLRLQSRKSSPNLPAPSDSSLDCEGNSSGDVAGNVEISRP